MYTSHTNYRLGQLMFNLALCSNFFQILWVSCAQNEYSLQKALDYSFNFSQNQSFKIIIKENDGRIQSNANTLDSSDTGNQCMFISTHNLCYTAPERKTLTIVEIKQIGEL